MILILTIKNESYYEGENEKGAKKKQKKKKANKGGRSFSKQEENSGRA